MQDACLTTPAGLRLDPTGPLGTIADTWEGGIYRVVASRDGSRVLLLTIGYGVSQRAFETVEAALVAIDAEQADIATLFGAAEDVHG